MKTSVKISGGKKTEVTGKKKPSFSQIFTGPICLFSASSPGSYYLEKIVQRILLHVSPAKLFSYSLHHPTSANQEIRPSVIATLVFLVMCIGEHPPASLS